MAEIGLVDVSIRDGNQSLWGAVGGLAAALSTAAVPTAAVSTAARSRSMVMFSSPSRTAHSAR